MSPSRRLLSVSQAISPRTRRWLRFRCGSSTGLDDHRCQLLRATRCANPQVSCRIESRTTQISSFVWAFDSGGLRVLGYGHIAVPVGEFPNNRSVKRQRLSSSPTWICGLSEHRAALVTQDRTRPGPALLGSDRTPPTHERAPDDPLTPGQHNSRSDQLSCRHERRATRPVAPTQSAVHKPRVIPTGQQR